MQVEFFDAAKEELAEARVWYDKQRDGLGSQLVDEVESTIARIVEGPGLWPILEDDIRTCRTKRFPYGVVYHIEADVLCVIAVMHLHREPGYWRDRLIDR